MVDVAEPEELSGVYYFGCWRSAGHFFWLPGMRSLPKSRPQWYADTPWGGQVDGRLTPGRRDHRGRLPYDEMTKKHQGEAALHHKDGWTALAIHDFTVDGRPGCNSVFFIHAEVDFDTAVGVAMDHFPKVVARIGDIKLAETP